MTPLSKTVFALGLVCVFLTGSGFSENVAKRYAFSQPCMGTTFHIIVYSDLTFQETAKVTDEAFALANEMDSTFSDYLAESEVGQFNRSELGKPRPASTTLVNLLTVSQKISKSTGGAFDPTCGALSRLWRFSRRTKKLPPSESLVLAKAASGFSNLKIDTQSKRLTKLNTLTRLDFGGIAKGFTADKILLFLREKGFDSSSVSAGGDVVVGSPPPGKDYWLVEIRPYGDEEQPNFKIKISNAAVSTSGDSEQAILINGTRYSHIIDPNTGLGLASRNAATVIAANGTQSDPLATALCVMGKQGLKTITSIPKTEAALFLENNKSIKTLKTAGFEKYRE